MKKKRMTDKQVSAMARRRGLLVLPKGKRVLIVPDGCDVVIRKDAATIDIAHIHSGASIAFASIGMRGISPNYPTTSDTPPAKE